MSHVRARRVEGRYPHSGPYSSSTEVVPLLRRCDILLSFAQNLSRVGGAKIGRGRRFPRSPPWSFFMARTSFPMIVLVLLFGAIVPCFAQSPGSSVKPIPTFEDSVRAELANSRNNYQATARMLESWRTRGYIAAAVGVACGVGAILIGAGPGVAILVTPSVIGGLLQAADAGALRRVMQGQDPSRRSMRKESD